eukprot:545171-Alexandrium_andersonii.AAC.1
MGDLRRRMVGERAELCSKCGGQVAYASGRQCHWCHLWQHVRCLAPCEADECSYLFCQQCEPLRVRPTTRAVGRVDTGARRLDPER